MPILKSFVDFVKAKYNAWRAIKVREFQVKQIAQTLKIAHAVELANTPGELWPVKRAEHARQIAAVRDGDITIVDRRSWQFPYLPSSITRIRQPILKMTPFNIRRFAKSPVPRRALNLIKNGVISLEWDVSPIKGTFESVDDDTRARIESARFMFNHPNGTDSFQSFMEQNLEDFVLLGAMGIEPQVTPDPKDPLKMWSVDVSTIRIFPTWTESNSDDEPRYAQMTGLLGERGIVPFMDDELLYLRDNPSNETPFGLGKMEVAFQSVMHFLGVQEMSGRAGADQLHKDWLWWTGSIAPAHLDVIRRHITNEQEGQAKVSLMYGAPKPEVISINPVQEADLLLNWQELLIRIICLAFDMSPAKFLERDVNRATGEVLEAADFQSAVVPVAVKIAEGFTRFFLHRTLGWTDLEFKFLNIDDPDIETKVTIAQQMYAMNATTGNEVRVSMGKPKLASKFADMTQFELILIQTEAAGKVQNQNAENAANRQMSMQEKQMQMYQTYQDPSQQGDGSEQSAAAGGTGLAPPKPPKLASLKPPKLTQLTTPKLPMAGCWLNAQQVAQMSPAELKAAIRTGKVTSNIKFLCQQMETQEPGILQQMSDELTEYLDTLQEEQDEENESSDVEPSAEDKAKQEQKYKQFQHEQTQVEKDYNVTRLGTPKTRTQPAEGTRQMSDATTVRTKKKLKNSRTTKVVKQ